MQLLFFIGVILIICAVSSKVLYRYGIPTLIIFLGMGMLMGSDGIGGIYFDNTELAKHICNIALIFIMFAGGFDTNWKTGKSVAVISGVLATLGVALTAFLIGLFAYFFLGFDFLESMLLGSIISSTDAASVFSILRSQKLNLKNNLAPLLEMESGSNDPMSYMLTTIFLGLILGQGENIFVLLFLQLFIGALFGFLIAKMAIWLMNHINLDIDGLYSIIVIGTALIAFAGADLLYGNGFLAVYITGLIMGNSKLIYKISLVRYFDGLSWIMQIMLFFTLGLLVFPSHLPAVAYEGILMAIFIIFLARPLAIAPILTFFKRPLKDQILVSWVGFRGAASIVFATYPFTAGLTIAKDIFNIVFFVALVSVVVQGTFFIPLAKKLDLVNQEETVLKTFTDYSGEVYSELLEIVVTEESPLAGKSIMKLETPVDFLVVMIKRDDKIITPHGKTVIKPGDYILIAGDNKNDLIQMDKWFKEVQLA